MFQIVILAAAEHRLEKLQPRTGAEERIEIHHVQPLRGPGRPQVRRGDGHQRVDMKRVATDYQHARHHATRRMPGNYQTLIGVALANGPQQPGQVRRLHLQRRRCRQIHTVTSVGGGRLPGQWRRDPLGGGGQYPGGLPAIGCQHLGDTVDVPGAGVGHVAVNQHQDIRPNRLHQHGQKTDQKGKLFHTQTSAGVAAGAHIHRLEYKGRDRR